MSRLLTAGAVGLVALNWVGGCAAPRPPSAELADAPIPSIAQRTRQSRAHEGLLRFHLDDRRGRLWLELPTPDEDGVVGRYLYVEGLLTGLGSNPVGLDRGQLGASHLVRLLRVGGRLLVEEENPRFRALSSDPQERRSVEQSFARSVLWAGAIAAEDPDGRFLVDFTPFLVRDAHDVTGTLRRSGQGEFELDPARSALDPKSCLAFPDNLEFEATLTFKSERPGPEVLLTAPVPSSVTLTEHHSLIRLPDAGYRPRRFDPRAGSFAVRFKDYAAALDAPLDRQWIVRHRLEKINRSAAVSKVVEPIVYYVDPATPEPVRSALVEGASWWAEAFERAGFLDAFRVELLPEGAHPLDVRYNVIQWVHRATRGWSYGGGVIDPRTGEMIKGHVSLGSLRVRQDRLIFEGLLGTEKTGRGGPDDPVELALARIRQLAAHEVGHTLGLAHNFAASTYGHRASVMDYPAPLLKVSADGTIDASDAYAVGVGAWDLHAIRYAYAQFAPDVDENAALEEIVQEGLKSGLVFLTDHDARPAGAAQPLASLWDNGEDPVTALQQTLEVRRAALGRFGAHNVAGGEPLARLEEVFATVYLHHRYQLEATVKMIGGLRYRYALAGDGQPAMDFVATERQRAALEVILRTLGPEFLDIPENVLGVLVPRPFGDSDPDRERFGTATAPAFDALGAAATAADLTVRALLQPQRCARLVDFHRRDPTLPSLPEVLDALVAVAFHPRETGRSQGAPRERWLAEQPLRERALTERVQRVLVDRMIELADDPATTPGVRERVEEKLEEIAQWLEPGAEGDAHARVLRSDIRRYLDERIFSGPSGWRPAAAPPGSPIGAGSSPAPLFGCNEAERPVGLRPR